MGIAHVAFRVSDYEKSRNFYNKLGFQQAFEFADPGKPRVSFIKINDRQFIELYERTDNSQQLGLMHICFETDDITSLRSAYIKEGLEATEIKKFRAGNLLFVIHDPEGQLIEYTQYLPASLHSQARGKYLGDQRISERLLEISTPAQDFSAQRSFYSSKLGFQPVGSSTTQLLIPGKSGERIELLRKSAAPQAKIVFKIKNLRSAARNLRGLQEQRQGRDLSTSDPDGTLVVFTTGR